MSRAEEKALKAFPEAYPGHNEYDRKCFIYGYEQAEKDLIALIESRIAELIGDAQPRPILRMELQGIIDKLNEL